MAVHVVKSGDTFVKIAGQYGIDDWRLLYRLQDNTFRRKRPSPHNIFPGDRIAIPQQMIRSAHTPKAGPQVVPKVALNAAQCAAPMAPAPTAVIKPQITEQDVRKGDLPDAFITFFSKSLDLSAGQAKKYIDKIGKGGTGNAVDAASGIRELYRSWTHFRGGQELDGLACLLKGVGDIWSALDEGTRRKGIARLARMLRKVQKLRRVVPMLGPLDQCDALTHMLKLLAAVLEGKPNDASKNSGQLLIKLKQNPGVAADLADDIALLFGEMIPKRLRTKLLAKTAGRKVPVLGTIAVGISDLYDIWSEPTSLLKWTGLGSTLAGLIPVAGTAVSVVLDIGIIIGTIIENLNDIHVTVSGLREELLAA